MAAARTNRVFVACCDRTGTERGVDWSEGTGVVGADGGRAVGVLSLYDDGRVGHSLLATDPAPIAARTPERDFLSIGVDD
jgi:hypothetical protein